MFKNTFKTCIAFLSILSLAKSSQLFAQTKATYTVVKGTVYEKKDGKLIPLKQATVSITENGASTTTNASGEFEFHRIPSGIINLHASYVGKVAVDTAFTATSSQPLNLILTDNSFRLVQVDVTAKSTKKAAGTGSIIGRNAIEHLQATSLADVMSLVPGGLTTNPDLSKAKLLNIRGIANKESNINAFGTSIVVNGSPVSNNANLQSLNPIISGGTALSGGSAPNSGFDVRTIPVQNIESVEVIRGIPDVEYGDATSGTVIVKQKAGKENLRLHANTNPNLYNFWASKGFDLGGNKGALNVGLDYSKNMNDPVQSYVFYQRASLNTIYSNDFFQRRLSSNTTFNVTYGKDTRRQNPDDEITKVKSNGSQLGFNFTTEGTYKFEDQWLKNIKYSGSIGLTDKKSYYSEQYTAATAPYSMSYSDGAILTNFPGKNFYDTNGGLITNIPVADQNNYAVYLPSTYVGEYNIRGKEFNTYLKTVANFFNQIGNTNHRWSLGADFKSDKNFGAGKTFADSLPPYRSLSYENATFRKRKYSDIPALNQFGIFAQENFSANIGLHEVNILAGLRYDRYSEGKSALSPRINASIDIIPQVLTLRGGYGMMAKAPSLLYLHPENAYFEYINVNELASTTIPQAEQVFMTTTHVFSTENEDLKITKNKKSEIGFDLHLGKSQLRVTGFDEKLKDGYSISTTLNSFQPVQYIEYKRANASQPVYVQSASNPVLAKFNRPNNNANLDKQGVELQWDLERIDAIRTQFSLYGAIIQQKSYSSDFVYYDGQSSSGGASRTHIGLYEPKMTVDYNKSAVTTLKATHNIPDIGFVISLTTEVIWNESSWKTYGNDSIPVKYISKIDGQVYDFDASRKDENEFKSLLRPVSRPEEIKESLPPLVNFNINITKEIKDFMRISFFANNLFRSYQVAQSDRSKSLYYKRNIDYFFGFNVGITLK